MTVDLEPNEWQALLQAAGNGGTYNQMAPLMQKVMGQLNAAAAQQAAQDVARRSNGKDPDEAATPEG